MSDRIRVSCAGLCRIERQGHLLLLVNRDRRAAHQLYILSPLGGALSVFDPACLEPFGAIQEDPDQNDLRLSLPVESLPAFREWFYSGEGRERSPVRELQEELVAESHLLPTLAPEDVGWRYLRTIETEGFTMRRGQTGLLTHYFLEIYAVWFQNDALFARLIDAPPESGAAWVPIETVRQCGTFPLTIDGARRDAAVNGYLLLEPGPEGR